MPLSPGHFWFQAARLAFFLTLPSLAGAGESVVLQLGGEHQFRYAGFYAAIEKGFYRDADLELAFRPAEPGSTNSVAAVVQGQADFGIGNSQLIVHRANKQPVVALAALEQHSPAALLMRQQAATDNIHHIASRATAIGPEEEELLAYLQAEQVPLDNISRPKPGPEAKDLIQGRDAVISGTLTQTTYDLAQSGTPYVAFSPRSAGLDFYGDTLFTSEKQISRHQGSVQRFVAASLQGWRYALAHPEEIIQLIRRDYAPNADLDRLRHEARHMAALIQAEVIPLGTQNPARWQAIAAHYAQLGLMDKDMPLEDFLFQPDRPSPRTPWLLGLGLLATLILAAAASYGYHTNRQLRGQIKEIMSLEQALRDDALRDPLTGLFNRRYLHETLPHEISRAARQDYPLSVAMVDIDHFKNINDSYGHLVGDEVIKNLSQLLNQTLRRGDLASRWGGEEFLLVMPNTPKEVARERAAVWCEEFTKIATAAGREVVRATLSAGIATFPEDGESVNDIVQAADLALYLAKSGGRNQVVSFPASS